jgi:hypothetical protein
MHCVCESLHLVRTAELALLQRLNAEEASFSLEDNSRAMALNGPIWASNCFSTPSFATSCPNWTLSSKEKLAPSSDALLMTRPLVVLASWLSAA